MDQQDYISDLQTISIDHSQHPEIELVTRDRLTAHKNLATLRYKQSNTSCYQN